MSATVSPDTTRNLAAYIAGLCGETLPADVDRMARLCLMDWIGCAVAGASLKGSRVIREVLTQSAAAGRSTIVGGDCALDAAAAVVGPDRVLVPKLLGMRPRPRQEASA